MGDWHLLSLGIGPDSLLCSIDGSAVPILHWTPLGYQYDEKSLAIRSALDNSKPTVSSIAQAATLEATSKVSPSAHCGDFTKGHPLLVAVGGLKYEQGSYNLACKQLQSGDSGLSSKPSGLATLVQALDHTVAGFCGTIGEVVIIPGPVEESRLLAWAREGPMNGFRETKLTRLSALPASALRVPESIAANRPGPEPSTAALAFPTFLGPVVTESAAIADAQKSLKVFASSGNVYVREKDDLFGKARSVRDKESVKFSTEVQIHQTAALATAFGGIGGIKALYPLLSADKARMVAALRILASLIACSKDAYQEFRTIEADKVMMYCAVQNPRLVTLETIQVLFDLIVESTAVSPQLLLPLHPAQSALGQEAIHRVALLELLVDLVISLPRNNQLARSTIDWLREICDENVGNCQRVLKSPGLLPVLIMLSSWDLPGCEALQRSGSLLLDAGSSSSKGTGPDGNSADQARIRRERSLSLGSAPDRALGPRARQAVDISKAGVSGAALGDAAAGKSDVEDKVAGEGRVRLMDRVNKEFMQKAMADEQDSNARLAQIAERYKMQLSCARLVKVLISGTSGEVAHGSASTTNLLSTCTDFSPLHLSTLLGFALVAAR
jgi:hypothetical protein